MCLSYLLKKRYPLDLIGRFLMQWIHTFIKCALSVQILFGATVTHKMKLIVYKPALTRNKSSEVFKPLSHSGISKHVHDLPSKTTCYAWGVIELLDDGTTQRPPGIVKVVASNIVIIFYLGLSFEGEGEGKGGVKTVHHTTIYNFNLLTGPHLSTVHIH